MTKVERMKRFALGATLAGLIATAPLASAAAQGEAGAPSLDPAQTLHDNLARIATGKQGVELTLRGGKSYRGRVAKVGDHAVLLTELEGREFYDAWISLEDIAAVEIRVRGNR